MSVSVPQSYESCSWWNIWEAREEGAYPPLPTPRPGPSPLSPGGGSSAGLIPPSLATDPSGCGESGGGGEASEQWK